MDEMTLTLNSPITEDQWDMIEDVDFDHTDSITFYTKHGKEVEFVKRKTGKWINEGAYSDYTNICAWHCSECGEHITAYPTELDSFCRRCGALMGEQP